MKNFSVFVEENYISEDASLLKEQMDLLYEKLVVFGGGAKYGQIIFMSGGAGSGKGFASSNFMEKEKFKVRDVDEWKKAFLEIAKLKNKYPEIQGLNLRDSDDVFKLHMFVKGLKIKNNTLNLILSDLKADRLPNIIFDITGKEMADFDEVIPELLKAGYDSKNISVAWVLTDYQIAYNANLTRDRVVPAPTFLETHQGASETMQKLIKAKKMPTGANGRFVVIMNNHSNTVAFKVGDQYKGKTVTTIPTDKDGKKILIPKSFYYIEVKPQGKPFNDPAKWEDELNKQIVANVPGGEVTIQALRAKAIETLSKSTGDAKKDAKNKEAVALVHKDIARDAARKAKKAK